MEMKMAKAANQGRRPSPGPIARSKPRARPVQASQREMMVKVAKAANTAGPATRPPRRIRIRSARTARARDLISMKAVKVANLAKAARPRVWPPRGARIQSEATTRKVAKAASSPSGRPSTTTDRRSAAVAEYPWISRVTASPPCQRDRARGVVLVGSFRHGLFRIAFTAYRSPGKGYSFDFPSRAGRPLAWPIDEPARMVVVQKLIEILKAKGRLPATADSHTTRTSSDRGGAP
jgi:hypothetical protein